MPDSPFDFPDTIHILCPTATAAELKLEQSHRPAHRAYR